MKTIKAKVHRLPTESSKILMLTNGNILTYYKEQESDGAVTPIHLYITTDEKIKEGDWYLWGGAEQKNIYQCKVSEAGDLDKLNTECKSLAKKIIATTDPKLHTNEIVEEDMHMYKKSLPQIPQSFIKEYCKAGGIDEVLVEYERGICKTCGRSYSCHNYRHPFVSTTAPKLNQDGTLAVSLVESGYYAIYDEVTNKTLHIQAPSLKDAEIIAAAIDFDNFVDGQSILTNPSVSLVEEKIEVDKLKLIEGLGRLRLTSDEELRAKYPLKPQVGMGIDWDKWIKENL